MEIIPIQQTQIQNEVVSTVNARDLHTELHIGKDFTNWIKAQLKRADLIEGMDFVVFAQKGEKPNKGRPTTEYLLTLDSAKHIAMMSQSKRAKDIRNYFISVEKKFKQIEKAYYANNNITNQEIIALTKAMTEQTKAIVRKLETFDKRLGKLETRGCTASVKNGQFIPNWILSSNLTPLEKLICTTIAAHSQPFGYCELKTTEIAVMHNKTSRSIQCGINSLYKKGVVKNIGDKHSRKLKLWRQK